VTACRRAVRRCVALSPGLVLLATFLLALSRPPNARAATHINTTTYTENTTWTTSGSPYVLDGDVTVASGVTLTVDPGVVVKFNGQVRQLTVNGTLTATATEANPITFTSYQDDTAGGDTNGDGAGSSGSPGQWYQVAFNSNTSHLSYVNIRYGGYGYAQNSAPIYAYGSSSTVALDHVTITQSQQSGVSLGNRASATMTDSTVSNNAYGIYADSSSVTVDHSTISNNSSRGIFFNLPNWTPLPPASTVTTSEITGNAGNGIYIGVNGDYPIAAMPHGTGNNIYGNDADGVQLRVNGYPGFARALVDWRGNYWGDQVYYWRDNPLCTSTTPNSPGHLAYAGSTGNVPPGPIQWNSYYVQPDIWTVYWCGYDAFKIDECDFSTSYISSTLQQVTFTEPKDVSTALSCADEAGLTPLQLASDFSVSCDGLWTGYLIDASQSTSDVVNDYGPMTESLFDELNAFGDVSCTYPGNAPIAVMTVEADHARPDPITLPPDWFCDYSTVQWWPSSGTIQTGPSYRPGYTGQRYIYQTFIWPQQRIDDLKDCDSHFKNSTYEPDAVFDNYDGLHYFGQKRSWASNLPRKYSDTRFSDNSNEPTYTIGSGDYFKLVGGKRYYTLMRMAAGNATTDRGKVQAQIGVRQPSFCYSTWCINSRKTEPVIPAWQLDVPGYATWSH
jgi:parallel beta-helix repeat protein